VVEGELLRWLVEGGGPAAERCLLWLVDGTAKSQIGADLVWPAAPWAL
jgi:hypothetical protein